MHKSGAVAVSGAYICALPNQEFKKGEIAVGRSHKERCFAAVVRDFQLRAVGQENRGGGLLTCNDREMQRGASPAIGRIDVHPSGDGAFKRLEPTGACEVMQGDDEADDASRKCGTAYQRGA